MARTQRFIERIRFGCSQDHLFMRVETAATIWPSQESPFIFRLDLTAGPMQARRRIEIPLLRKGPLQAVISERTGDGPGQPLGRISAVHFADCLDFGINFSDLAASPGDDIELALMLLRDGVELQRLPQGAHIELVLPDETFEGRNWLV
jgi:hypothetical protein